MFSILLELLQIFLNQKYFRCVPHNINLILFDSLSEGKVKTLIDEVRAFVPHFN